MPGSAIVLQGEGRQVSGLATVGRERGRPLLIALHGGGYNARYFDVPATSFLERCESAGYPAVALDRPGYGSSTPFGYGELSYAASAEVLSAAILDLWGQYGAGCPGVVLVGHSMGGAIACHIASRPGSWPLLGISMTGIAHEPPPGAGAVLDHVPADQPVIFPPDAIAGVMYGPAWTFAPGTPEAATLAVSPMPRPELVEVYDRWIEQAPALASKITIPVQAGLAEFDHFWIPGKSTVDGFAALFTASPHVEADVLRSTGHNVEHHYLAEAWHRRVLAFTDLCALEAARPAS
jgi:pimeloyl-ACP methyl ester carboxylesterase